MPADRKCAALQRRCRTISGCRTNAEGKEKICRILKSHLPYFITVFITIHSYILEIDFSALTQIYNKVITHVLLVQNRVRIQPRSSRDTYVALQQSCNLFFPFWHPEYFLPEIISEKFSARKFLLENVCQKLSDQKISITILSEK